MHKRTSEYNSWAGMKQRCLNSNNKAYKHYGGRGITVCMGWRFSYANFLSNMGLRPPDKHSIDRINNDGGYWCGRCEECTTNNWPFNCRWATHLEQHRNNRRYLERMRRKVLAQKAYSERHPKAGTVRMKKRESKMKAAKTKIYKAYLERYPRGRFAKEFKRSLRDD